jgi:hypothetical protein
MELNNYLQTRFATTKYLTWDAVHVGPNDAGNWVVVAFCKYLVAFSCFPTDFVVHQIVNGVEHGRGINGKRGAAAEVAAQQTLVALRGY